MHNDMFSPEKINPEEASAVIAEVSKIVTISKYVGNVIRELYPQAASKLRAIYSGVDSERFLPGRHPKMQQIRNRIRQEHGLETKWSSYSLEDYPITKVWIDLFEHCQRFQKNLIIWL